MHSANPATDFAVALLGEFVSRGVRDLVLSPGSRSQALALAAAEYERAGLIRLRVRIDERVSGFLALGLAVETRLPVLLVTTSGTAVANLHPAVLEAHHSGVPLILLTADRPGELRGIGSNQTTDQLDLFGGALRWSRDVEAPWKTAFDPDHPGELADEAFSAASGHSSLPGPVQLNIAFREPLSGRVDSLPETVTVGPPSPSHAPGTALAATPHSVVIAGHDGGPAAEQLARELAVPLIAELSSGARFGPNLVVGYRKLLADPEFGGRVSRAVVFGHPTLSREIPALLQRDDVEVLVVRSRAGEPYNPGHRARVVPGPIEISGAVDAAPEAKTWLGSWIQASRQLLDDGNGATSGDRPGDFAREQLAAYREPVTRRMLVELVWRATWPHDRLVFGASRLIRVADALLPGKRIPVHANRGLAGIDGTIATGIGIALASQANPESSGAGGTTRVVLGDLAALHDAGAMLFGDGEERPRIQVIVGNDGGGTIFDGLEVAASAPAEPFDRVLYTPQQADLAALAAAYGWAHAAPTNRGELDEALATPDGPTVIDVRLPRD
ncbi:2-succinyl-5-enolpyruvyl-6-hydroxy-3-cyclohexene-1-carboxylic-acid synthase [soil metagenome]